MACSQAYMSSHTTLTGLYTGHCSHGVTEEGHSLAGERGCPYREAEAWKATSQRACLSPSAPLCRGTECWRSWFRSLSSFY